jgi:hypothetical protein
MIHLKSPPNNENDSDPSILYNAQDLGQSKVNLDEEGGPEDDLIKVKIYFFAESKSLRLKVFP